LSIGAKLVPEAEETKACCIDNVRRLREDLGKGCDMIVIAGTDNIGQVFRLKPFPDQAKILFNGVQPSGAIVTTRRPTLDYLIRDIEEISGYCNQIDLQELKAL
jgi:hypothetical protein